MALSDVLQSGRAVASHRPWPRLAVDAAGWRGAIEALGEGEATLSGLWGDGSTVHMALLGAANAVSVLSLDCPERRFPSVGAGHPPAIRLERAVRDLSGLEPEQAPDLRPWPDHGRWGLARPLGGTHPLRSGGPAAAMAPYEFLTSEGEGLHQIPVGPVHAGIIEPGHFRFTANGETVVRLEQRLGYVHKGVEALMAGATLERGAALAGRLSGDSTVAYAIAFARAVEAAVGIEAPNRAHWLRALMAELERIANHCGDIGAVCNDAAFAIMLAQFGMLREQVLRAAANCFGHRLMMDRVVPGGVAADLDSRGVALLRELVARLRAALPRLIRLYDGTASLQDRTVATGFLRPDLARQFGAGGHVGRASGRDFDTRRELAYPPYDRLRFTVPVLQEGDVNARVWIRIREVEQSLALVEQILAQLPEGPVRVPIAGVAGEGMAMVEAFRGDVLVWLRLGPDGTIERCHLRDASWFQWPLLEIAIKDNIVADFPLCNKSFNCSYSGHDL